MKHLSKLLVIMFAALMLAACGGNGGNTEGDTGTNSGSSGGSSDNTASLSISFDTHSISYGNPGTATITLDANGTGISVANKVIDVTSEQGLLSPSTGMVLTDASGKATILVTDAGVKTAGILTAALHANTSVTASAGFELAGDAPDAVTPDSEPLPVLKVAFTGSNGSAITGADAGTATITLTDPNQSGITLGGQVIQVTSTAGNLDPATGMVMTDSNGKATITLKDGGVKTAGILTAILYSNNTVKASTAFTMSGSGQAAIQPKISVTLSSHHVSDASPVTATIQLDANGTSLNIANQLIKVATNGTGVLDPASGMVLTDSTGKASVTIKDGGVKTAGVLVAQLASNAAVVDSASFDTAGDATGNQSLPTITVVFNHTNISNGNPGTATITLDENGTSLDVTNQVIDVTTTGGVLSPASGMVLTNGSGVATITLGDAGVETAGILSASLHSNGAVTGSASFSLAGDAPQTTIPKPILSVSFVGGNAITGTNDGQIEITLTDPNGTGITLGGQVIQVTSTAGNLDPATGMVMTNGSGVATITLKDGGIATAGIVTATLLSDTTVTGSAAFTMDGTGSTNSQPKLSAISISNSGGQITTTNPITAIDPATVTVTLTQADGTTFIPNAAVNFSLSSAVGSLSQASALTSLTSGVATVTLNVGTVQGAGTLIASYTDADGNTVTKQASFAVQLGGGTGPSLTTPVLKDASNAVVGTIANPITENNPASVKVTLTNGATPIANKVITFSILGANGVGALDPATGTALTDSNGVATIKLESGANAGAATVKATYTEGANSVSSQIDFTTQGAGVVTQLTLDLGSGSGASFVADNIIAPTTPVTGSTYTIKVNVVDVNNSNSLYTDAPLTIDFNSGCAITGKATITPASSITIGGTAFISYSPKNGCTQDNISASTVVNGTTLTAQTGSFNLTASPANAISFVGASPAIIGIKGASQAGVKETSTLTFLVVDQNGNPVTAGTDITFTVQTPLGGFAISDGSPTGVQTETLSTGANGEVHVTVSSGTVPGVGTIKAALVSNPTIYGTGSVSVQQGVAVQNRFVMAIDTLNPAAANHVGLTDKVVVRAADRYGNWVPDGTIIHFATKLGDIDASCTIQDGGCSVTWTSQGVQPISFDKGRAGRACLTTDLTALYKQGLPYPFLLGGCSTQDRYGVNVITAWTTGEESFGDLNGNNVYDSATENYIDLPEYFQDYNLTGIYEEPDANYTGEDYGDKDSNGSFGSTTPLAAAKYNGLSCPASSNCTDELVNVRRSIVMVTSTDTVQMDVADTQTTTPPTPLPTVEIGTSSGGWGTTSVTWNGSPASTDYEVPNSAGGTLHVVLADLNGNAPAFGSTITVKAIAKDGVTNKPKVLGPSSCTVKNTLEAVVCSFGYIAGDAGNKFSITGKSATGNTITRVVAVQ